MLCSSPVLKSPDFLQLFTLLTDASDYVLGAVLSQKDESGDDHPICYLAESFAKGIAFLDS